MNRKIIISALALTIGAGLAGSITGTAAWYQYSTKANAALVGASGGTSGNLQIRFRKEGQANNAGWTTFISKEAMNTFISEQGYGSKIVPVTPGAVEKDGALTLDTNNNPVMYTNPVPGKGPYTSWNKANKANYVVIPLQIRYVDRDGVKNASGIDEDNVEKEVYLSDLVLQQPASDAANHKDLSEALRFHISSYTDEDPDTITSRLVSKNGGTTVTNGKLDIDGDGNNDVARPDDKYGFEDSGVSTEEIVYGEGQQESFSSKYDLVENQQYFDEENEVATDAKVYPMVAEPKEDDDYDLIDESLEYDEGKSKSIGKTVAAEDKFLNVDITIWVEGWQKFKVFDDEDDYSSIWDNSFIDSKFNVGFEFAINAEIDE